MRRICIMYIDDGGNVVVVQLTRGQARGLKVANSIDRQGSVALTADGAVSQILAHAHQNTGGGRLWSYFRAYLCPCRPSHRS